MVLQWIISASGTELGFVPVGKGASISNVRACQSILLVRVWQISSPVFV